MKLDQIVRSAQEKDSSITTEQVETTLSEMEYTPDQIAPNMIGEIVDSIKAKSGKSIVSQSHRSIPIDAHALSSQSKMTNRKSGDKKKNEPAKTAIAIQTQKVDAGFIGTDEKISQIEGYLAYRSEQTSDRIADVLHNAPDRFFQLVEEKVGQIEIDTSQFDKFSTDIDQMLEGFKNARTARSQA